MTYGSLFTGIGGLDLALEAFGHTPLWQAESDPYARAVLANHWPTVHCYRDVREIDATAPPPDILCGGFPCQDISNAGKRVGIDGERSGLWSEFARIIRALRPRFVFVENVAALTVRGLDRVLGDLATLGFDAEWDVLRAADVGAPHLRARIFILAYAQRADLREQQGRLGGAGWPGEAQPGEYGDPWPLADAGGSGQWGNAEGIRARQPESHGGRAHVANSERATRDDGSEVARACGDAEGGDGSGMHEPRGCSEDVAHADGEPRDARGTGGASESARGRDAGRRSALAPDVPDSDGGRCEGERRAERDGGEAGLKNPPGYQPHGCSGATDVADASGAGRGSEARDAIAGAGAGANGVGSPQLGRRHRGAGHPGWELEPDVGRVVAGLPPGVDGRGTGLGGGSKGIGGGRDRANRLRCLGNAVVWQQAALALEALTARARRASLEAA